MIKKSIEIIIKGMLCGIMTYAVFIFMLVIMDITTSLALTSNTDEFYSTPAALFIVFILPAFLGIIIILLSLITGVYLFNLSLKFRRDTINSYTSILGIVIGFFLMINTSLLVSNFIAELIISVIIIITTFVSGRLYSNYLNKLDGN